MPDSYSDEELLDDLRSVADDLGETPTAHEYSERGVVTYTVLADRFESWNDALRTAGLDINQEHKLTDEALLEEIHRLNDVVSATPPRKSDLVEHGNHSPRTYDDHFGSWNRAVEAAGFQPRPPFDHYRERPPACPLCEREETGLDFHHWRYGDNKIGCYLCRECHDAIHEGDARVLYVDWLPAAVTNLVARHVELHGEASVDAILDRYNLPSVQPLVQTALTSV